MLAGRNLSALPLHTVTVCHVKLKPADLLSLTCVRAHTCVARTLVSVALSAELRLAGKGGKDPHVVRLYRISSYVVRKRRRRRRGVAHEWTGDVT